MASTKYTSPFPVVKYTSACSARVFGAKTIKWVENGSLTGYRQDLDVKRRDSKTQVTFIQIVLLITTNYFAVHALWFARHVASLIHVCAFSRLRVFTAESSVTSEQQNNVLCGYATVSVPSEDISEYVVSLILLYKVEWCVWTEVGVICRIQV
jgi:hypothetical protein